MESKNLRKGNIVANEELDIFNNGYVQMEARWIYEMAVHESAQNCEEYAKKFQPVVLTKEWLLKLGFKEEKLILGNDKEFTTVYVKKDFAVRLHAHNHHIFRYLSVAANDFRWVCLYCTECKYVHHLQNAYWVLMKWEELELVM